MMSTVVVPYLAENPFDTHIHELIHILDYTNVCLFHAHCKTISVLFTVISGTDPYLKFV